MGFEYKSVGVAHVEQVKDEGDGIVSAFVSVTGIEDNVNDVILPGAYEETLKKRIPKGAWGHDWKTPTAKTLEAKELLPGDPELPKTLANGEPWPAEAGALRIKMQFNLDTQRGREAYADVTFFGDQQEWSIGYKVPSDGAYRKDGKRYIKKLELFEYSPVLFGAMSHARTATSVKDVQFALMQSKGMDINDLVRRHLQYKSEIEATFGDGADHNDDDFGDDEFDLDEFKADDEDDDFFDEDEEDGYLNDEDEDYFDDEEEEDEAKYLFKLRNEAAKLESFLSDMGYEGKSFDDIIEAGTVAYVEAKATEYSTVAEAVEAMQATLAKSDAEALQSAAEAMDDAVASEDLEAAEQAATEVLDIIEKVIESDDEGADSARVVARVVADHIENLSDEQNDSFSEDDGGDGEGKTWRDAETGLEFKSVTSGTTRTFGRPATTDNDFLVYNKSAQEVYVGCLDNDALLSLDFMLKNVIDDPGLKWIVDKELDSRAAAGEIEEKVVRRVRTAAGVRRFKQPIGSIIVGKGRLQNLKIEEPKWAGWDLVRDKRGRKYDVGRDDDGKYIATRHGDWNPIVSGSSLEEVYTALDTHVGGGKTTAKKTAAKPKASGKTSTGSTAAARRKTSDADTPTKEERAEAQEFLNMWINRVGRKPVQTSTRAYAQLDGGVRMMLAEKSPGVLRALASANFGSVTNSNADFVRRTIKLIANSILHDPNAARRTPKSTTAANALDRILRDRMKGKSAEEEYDGPTVIIESPELKDMLSLLEKVQEDLDSDNS